MQIKTTISTALLLLLSLNVNAFDATTIEGFFDDIKNSSVKLFKENEKDINEIKDKAGELYKSSHHKTMEFIDEQEKRYQNYRQKVLDIKLVDNKFHLFCNQSS
jgi:hypothetical protein